MLEAGIIRKSRSPWCSPINICRKKNGKIRVTIDFRALNKLTKRDCYPLPRIDELFGYLANSKIFTTLDMSNGYYQIDLDEESMEKTAFACELGFYEFTVMPMGLTNACATFQRFMNTVLEGLIGFCCLVYLDDIIIYGSIENHEININLVIERLEAHGLKINLEKCKIAEEQVQFLGHVISKNDIRPAQHNIDKLAIFKKPNTVKQVRGYLGLGGHYRKFMPGFSDLVKPLTELTEKGKKFVWSQACQDEFECLRTRLTSESVLKLADPSKPYLVETDSSNYGAGGVLAQLFSGAWMATEYFSRAYTKAETNYATGEKELYAIVLSCEHWKPVLFGRPFTILTDHKPLSYLMTVPHPAQRLACWIVRLQMFVFTIEYRPGGQNGAADGLSRIF